MKTAISVIALACIAAGCSTRQAAPENRTVRGVLKFYPGNVKSLEAWHGHSFKVDDTPILATEEVPAETLKKFVGRQVVVHGLWQPGRRWRPSEEEKSHQNPSFPEGEAVVVGHGLKASSISAVE